MRSLSKKGLYLIIIILALVILLFLVFDTEINSLLKSDKDTDGDGWTDDDELANGTDPSDPNDYPGSDVDDSDGTDDGDGTTPPPTGSWHQETYSGSGTAGVGDFTNSYFDLGEIPPFTTGSGGIQITFTHSWTTAGNCDAGMVWCVHDSNDAQIYHNMEYTPSTGTDTISGTWDGVNNWRVWVGNNCVNAVSFSYVITVRWYE
jgi:hypothetical protein